MLLRLSAAALLGVLCLDVTVEARAQQCASGRCGAVQPNPFGLSVPSVPAPALGPTPVGNPPGPDYAWQSLPGIGYGWVQQSAKKPVVAGKGSEWPVAGEVTGVSFSPSWGLVWLDVAQTDDLSDTETVIVLPDDPDARITIDGKPATAADLVAFLYSSRRPMVKAVEDGNRYGAVLKAEFTTGPKRVDPPSPVAAAKPNVPAPVFADQPVTGKERHGRMFYRVVRDGAYRGLVEKGTPPVRARQLVESLSCESIDVYAAHCQISGGIGDGRLLDWLRDHREQILALVKLIIMLLAAI